MKELVGNAKCWWGSRSGVDAHRDALYPAVVLGFMLPLLLVACDATGSADSAGDTAEFGDEILLDLANAGTLMAINAAPARALYAAKAWEAQEDEACPSRFMDGLVLVLTGGCTTESAVELSGTLRVDRVPDGGTWVFEQWREQDAGRDETWHGNLAWIQTDEANQLTAYDFVATITGGDAAFTAAAFDLDHDGRAKSASGSVTVVTESRVGTIGLAGEWDFADCTTAPVAGNAAWSTRNTVVSATFGSAPCGGCISWESANESGSWCSN